MASVDALIAQTLKVLTGHNYQKWLDEGDNADIWFGHQKGLTAMERRILITQWVVNAWQELCSSKYDHLRKRSWEKTGSLITADGSEDAKITPEGLADYKVPPPLSYLPACECQTLQIQLKMMKRNKRRKHWMKIWKNLKTMDQNLKIAKTIEVIMSCVHTLSKGCMKTVVLQEQFNISTKKWEDTEFCTMMTVRIT